MIITDFVKQTILRIGAVVTIPIRTNVIVETTQVIWDAKLGVGELRVYVKPCDLATAKVEGPKKSVTERQDDPARVQQR
jgi:hypothetical protein